MLEKNGTAIELLDIVRDARLVVQAKVVVRGAVAHPVREPLFPSSALSGEKANTVGR